MSFCCENKNPTRLNETFISYQAKPVSRANVSQCLGCGRLLPSRILAAYGTETLSTPAIWEMEHRSNEGLIFSLYISSVSQSGLLDASQRLQANA